MLGNLGKKIKKRPKLQEGYVYGKDLGFLYYFVENINLYKQKHIANQLTLDNLSNKEDVSKLKIKLSRFFIKNMHIFKNNFKK